MNLDPTTLLPAVWRERGGEPVQLLLDSLVYRLVPAGRRALDPEAMFAPTREVLCWLMQRTGYERLLPDRNLRGDGWNVARPEELRDALFGALRGEAPTMADWLRMLHEVELVEFDFVRGSGRFPDATPCTARVAVRGPEGIERAAVARTLATLWPAHLAFDAGAVIWRDPEPSGT